MTDADYQQAVTDTLQHIEQAVERCGADVDFEMSGDILTLEFANGSKIIINKQGAIQQLWVAAKSGGFHYNRDDATGQWRNDQNGMELFVELSKLVSEQAGEAVTLMSRPG